MKHLHLVAVLALSGAATAQHTTVTGGPSAIPSAGTGGGTTYPTLPPTPGTADVVVPTDIASLTSIEVAGLTHTWIGDLQMVLVDPNGVGHLVFLRPGYLNTGAAGNSGDFLGGTYTFVESGGMSLPSTSTTSTNPPAGTYNQTFTSGGVVWVDGSQGIFNTPLNSVAGPAGTWTLRVYDWVSADVGAWTSFTLNYRTTSGPATPICFGDGSGAPCGCLNESPTGSGAGCLNGLGVGAVLTASGTPSVAADTLSLEADGVTNQPGLFFQGVNTIGGGTGVTFGDGIRCCGGSVVRIQIVDPPGPAVATTAQMTETATTNGMAGTIVAGDKKCYQYWYRDPAGSPCGANFNLSSAVSVTWLP